MASWRGTCQVDRAVQRALQVEVERMGKARAQDDELFANVTTFGPSWLNRNDANDMIVQ